jgi:hypothetical protein
LAAISVGSAVFGRRFRPRAWPWQRFRSGAQSSDGDFGRERGLWAAISVGSAVFGRRFRTKMLPLGSDFGRERSLRTAISIGSAAFGQRFRLRARSSDGELEGSVGGRIRPTNGTRERMCRERHGGSPHRVGCESRRFRGGTAETSERDFGGVSRSSRLCTVQRDLGWRLRRHRSEVRNVNLGSRSGLGLGPVNDALVSAAQVDGVGSASTALVSAAQCDGVDAVSETRFRSRDASRVGFARTGWVSAQAALGRPRSERVEPASVGSAGTRARAVLELRTSVRETGTTWPVSETVDEHPSGWTSSGLRATGGCKHTLGDRRMRSVKLHGVGGVARLERVVRSSAQSSARLTAVDILCSGAQGYGRRMRRACTKRWPSGRKTSGSVPHNSGKTTKGMGSTNTVLRPFGVFEAPGEPHERSGPA